MALSGDLAPDALAAALGERPARAYRALVSTEADARAWARAGAPGGAVVVADFQAAARGRGGLPWPCRPGADLGFTVILRPALAPDDEGWLYVGAAAAVLDVLGGDATVAWPDRIEQEGRHVADVAGHAGLGAGGVEWAIVNVLIREPAEARAPLLERLVRAVEARAEPGEAELARYAERCTTLGRRVVAHLIPTWPDGVQIAGTAVRVLPDGALVVEQDDGRRMAVRPQHLARLEDGQPAPRT